MSPNGEGGTNACEGACCARLRCRVRSSSAGGGSGSAAIDDGFRAPRCRRVSTMPARPPRALSSWRNRHKPPGWSNPTNPATSFPNSDMAFQGNYAFVGNFNGFQHLRHLQPGGAGPDDVGRLPGRPGRPLGLRNLLFMSVEETRAKKDCTLTPAADATTRFRGVRIFDISNIRRPVQVGRRPDLPRLAHAHAGAAEERRRTTSTSTSRAPGGVRAGDRARGLRRRPGRPTRTRRSGGSRSSRSRSPHPRPRRSSASRGCSSNETTGRGQRPAERPADRRCTRPATAWGRRCPDTNSCHDITVYEELDLAAGACEGNGLLIDISDPANPKRIDAVADPLFAYWHGATFSNDGKKVFFTDEWGGGTTARCRATDQLSWGANAIYEIVNRKLVFRSYYKLPVAQTTAGELRQPHPVADPGPRPRHLRPGLVPGRRVAGRLHRPVEPEGDRLLRPRPDQRRPALVLGGFWSTYWYNGAIYGSEIARGFDVVRASRRPPTCRRARSPPPSAGQVGALERAEPGPVTPGRDAVTAPWAATCRRRCR